MSTSPIKDAGPTGAPAMARRGFTLTEILIVIAIVVVLIGLLIPILNMVNRQAAATRTSATLASIGTALDAYRADFGDIPRFSADDPNFPNPLNSSPERGARLLARALTGPAPANDAVTDPNADPADLNYAKTAFQDGHGDAASPFGFKERRQIVTRDEDGDGTPETGVQFPGKVYTPYLDPERFEVRQTADTAWSSAGYKYGPDAVFLDPGDRKPILYYPALARQPAITEPSLTFGDGGAYIAKWDPAATPRSLYNASDNIGLFEDIDPRDPSLDPDHSIRFFFRELLGDLVDQNGVIGADERAVIQPYLLIAVGNSGNYYQTPIINFDAQLPERYPPNE